MLKVLPELPGASRHPGLYHRRLDWYNLGCPGEWTRGVRGGSSRLWLSPRPATHNNRSKSDRRESQ